MGTLTQLMWLSRSALAADQQAIDVTASNVANQNTVGYTREVVSFRSVDAVQLNGRTGTAIGVEAKAVSQRDRVLEQRLQQQTQGAYQASARLTALQSAEQVFGLSSNPSNASTTAIGAAIDGFFSSLTALAANPSDAATRSAALSAAGTLTAAFNGAAQQLDDNASTINAQIGTSAGQVNALTSQVAQLNAEITSLSPDQDAGGLEDQRQEAIQKLSQLVGVNQMSGSNNDVTLTTSNGAVLVSAGNSFPLGTATVVGKTEVTSGDPAVVISAGLTGGTIGGLLQARDADLPGMQSSLDALAFAVGSAVNAQNASGVTSSGAAGGAVFNLGATATGSAQNIALAITSSDGLATAAAGEGVGGTTNANALAALGSAKIANGDTASGSFATLLGGIGTTVQSATAASDAKSAALTQAQTQRDALSGVSLDEEAAALTQYQRSYEAAAKVLAAVNAMMASALNLGEQTTVS